MEKYLYKYVFLKDGRYFYINEIIDGVAYSNNYATGEKTPYYFEDKDVDHLADEVCKSVLVE